jgi:hypothetical protein
VLATLLQLRAWSSTAADTCCITEHINLLARRTSALLLQQPRLPQRFQCLLCYFQALKGQLQLASGGVLGKAQLQEGLLDLCVWALRISRAVVSNTGRCVISSTW